MAGTARAYVRPVDVCLSAPGPLLPPLCSAAVRLRLLRSLQPPTGRNSPSKRRQRGPLLCHTGSATAAPPRSTRRHKLRAATKARLSGARGVAGAPAALGGAREVRGVAASGLSCEDRGHGASAPLPRCRPPPTAHDDRCGPRHRPAARHRAHPTQRAHSAHSTHQVHSASPNLAG